MENVMQLINVGAERQENENPLRAVSFNKALRGCVCVGKRSRLRLDYTRGNMRGNHAERHKPWKAR